MRSAKSRPGTYFVRAIIGAALAVLATSASAKVWPTKPIRAFVPFSAGGAVDVLARMVFHPLATRLGQPVVVENRVGAGSTIAAGLVARAHPNGYTILVDSSVYTLAPSTYPNLSYNAGHDLSAVMPLGSMPMVLVTSPAKGIKTISELVAAAKAKPGLMTYATVGLDSAAYLSANRLMHSAGFKAQPVAFNGARQALLQVMAGRVDFYFSPVLPALSLIRSGKLLALAVSSSQRIPQLANVPTTVAAGYANSEYNLWFGIFVPAKTPRPIIEKLYRETRMVLAMPSTQKKLSKLDVQPMKMTPEEFEAEVRREIKANAALVRAAGIKAK